MKKVKIYALQNPIDGKYFYVGATTIALASRLSYHCSKIFYGWYLSDIVSKRIELIREIKKANMKPNIVLLAEVNKSATDYWERIYYKRLSKQGFNLFQDATKFCYTRQQTELSIAERTLKSNGGKR